MFKLNVLIVDDEKSILEILSKIINGNSNYSCDTCGNGKEAIALVAKNDYDLVITDIKMPGIDGIEVLEEIKNTKPETEVVLLTGFASMNNLIQATKFEAYDYLQKPFKADRILSILEKIGNMKEIAHKKNKFKVESKECKKKIEFEIEKKKIIISKLSEKLEKIRKIIDESNKPDSEKIKLVSELLNNNN